MQLAFSTLGAPDWDLEALTSRAARYGYDGIDFRGYLEDIDVTTRHEFTDHAGDTAAMFEAAGLEVSAVSTSIGLCKPDDREENVAEAERSIEVANAVGAEYLRVFGFGDLDAHSREELADIAARTMDDVLALEGAEDLTWMVETHDNWIDSADCRLLLDRIDAPNVGALWDMGHTPRVGDESPEETIETLGDSIVYTHLKDAVHEPDHPDAMDSGWRYVTPGEGELPLEEALRALDARGYDGWVTLEHEKRWHPELPDADAILPDAADWFRGLDL